MSRSLPPSANVAQTGEDARLHAPAAARNVDALCTLLREHAPQSGRALEIASGTGQHVAAFAMELPNLDWHPTEIDPVRRASIDAYAAAAALSNVRKATSLDATHVGWSGGVQPFDLITLANLLHLISTSEAQVVVREAAAALAAGGTVILYGPFRRAGALISAGDAKFDAELRAADGTIGYKDSLDIAAWLGDAELTDVTTQEMPANNLAFIARKPLL